MSISRMALEGMAVGDQEGLPEVLGEISLGTDTAPSPW